MLVSPFDVSMIRVKGENIVIPIEIIKHLMATKHLDLDNPIHNEVCIQPIYK
jgi:hypothetical protein